MADTIKYNSKNSASHASQLKKGEIPRTLNPVPDDNTKAEKGVYDTYDKLRGFLIDVKDSMQDDASNIKKAGDLLASTDSLIAKGIQPR